MLHRLGWVRDTPDQRDARYSIPFFSTLPPLIDLRDGLPHIFDQGDLGSCTANAAAGVVTFLQRKQGETPVDPSRLFGYFHARELEGSVDSDAGATLRDTVKVLAKLGAPPETDWPYDVDKFADEPPPAAHADALKQQAIRYGRVSQREHSLKSVLASGFPILFGFAVYESMMTDAVARSGDVPMPGLDEAMIGGHAIWLAGYDDATRRYRFANSWGTGWGAQGWGTMPYEYVHNVDLCADFWCVRLIEDYAA